MQTISSKLVSPRDIAGNAEEKRTLVKERQRQDRTTAAIAPTYPCIVEEVEEGGEEAAAM